MKGRIDVHVTVTDLAVLVNGTVHGDGQRAIRAAKPVAEAWSSDVTFVENERNVRLLTTCRAAVVVAPAALAERISELRGVDGQNFTVVQVKDALAGFVAIAQTCTPSPTRLIRRQRATSLPHRLHSLPDTCVHDKHKLSWGCDLGFVKRYCG